MRIERSRARAVDGPSRGALSAHWAVRRTSVAGADSGSHSDSDAIHVTSDDANRTIDSDGGQNLSLLVAVGVTSGNVNLIEDRHDGLIQDHRAMQTRQPL